MESLLQHIETADARRLLIFTAPEHGLRAFLVIDELERGPAAGGIRTQAYASPLEAVRDACRLSRAMTLKCAISDLGAGGAKMVVLDDPGLDRPGAFRELGRRVEELRGQFLTAGDLGTTAEDLRHMAETTQYVRTDDAHLAEAVGASVTACATACARHRGLPGLEGLSVAIQGCGAMGSAVARAFVAAGARVRVADVDSAAAERLAAATGGNVIDPGAVLTEAVDIVAPCAVGGVLDANSSRGIRAWAVCGAANNMLADPQADEILADRGVMLVPDFISSSGALIAGICAQQRRDDAADLIAALGRTTAEVLDDARARQEGTVAAGTRLALHRLGRDT
jgi:leucine dehydrogenase